MLAIEEALQVLMPREEIRTIRWAIENASTDTGNPYSDFAYPHLGAPGGPFDAFDCPQYQDIWLQWGSRLGKTYGGEVALLKAADCDPSPGMLASSNEKLATEVIERTYGMIRHIPSLKARLPKKTRQSSVDLRLCRIHVAWARSVSTLADKAVRVGHANEIDKWEHLKASKEADPLKLFDERFKEFPTFKRWKEGTPAVKFQSRVEAGRLASCNASYWVPCPHCNRYQVLILGDGSSHGLRWQKSDAGKHDVTLALQTGYYVCQHCDERINDDRRGWMMRCGVWVPEGCGCDDEAAMAISAEWRDRADAWKGWKEDAPWITGTPLRDGNSWGSHLSSFYALSLSWGKLAEERVKTLKRPSEMRNYVNSWLAETWNHKKDQQTWERLGERMICDVARGRIPIWGSLITVGIDRQADDRFPWIVIAWGPADQCHVVAYGECLSFDELERVVVRPTYQHADGGAPLRIEFGLFDSGHKPHGVHEFCLRMQRDGFRIFPCKGSNTALESDYRVSTLGPNTAMPGATQVMVDTIRSQMWMEDRLAPSPTGERLTTVHSGSLGEHQDFLEQVLNDAPVEGLDSHNNVRESWDRINTDIPNDLRDGWRYAWVARRLATGGRDVLPRKYREPPPAEPEQPGRIRTLKIRGR